MEFQCQSVAKRGFLRTLSLHLKESPLTFCQWFVCWFKPIIIYFRVGECTAHSPSEWWISQCFVSIMKNLRQVTFIKSDACLPHSPGSSKFKARLASLVWYLVGPNSGWHHNSGSVWGRKRSDLKTGSQRVIQGSGLVLATTCSHKSYVNLFWF